MTSSGGVIHLTAALADKKPERHASPVRELGLLVVDEFGLDRIERDECPQAAHLLYKIIASRNEKRSTIVITNVGFDACAQYLGDAGMQSVPRFDSL